MAVSTGLLTNSVEKTGVYVPCFNLPRSEEVCIGATPACRDYCYADRFHFKGPRVIAKYADNLRRSKLPDFREAMISELRMYAFRGVNRIRLHSSGDFYSQEYLDHWKAAARAVPGITIVAYTRSYQLDFRRLPRNFTIFYSIDCTTTDFPQQKMRWAYVVPRKQYTHGDIPNTFICKSHCHSCKACFVPSKKDVVFYRH